MSDEPEYPHLLSIVGILCVSSKLMHPEAKVRKKSLKLSEPSTKLRLEPTPFIYSRMAEWHLKKLE